MTELNLSLQYQLAPGWLKPFTSGLTAGKAMAWMCTACKHTSFPPVRTCTCGLATGEWIELSGSASIVYHTHGLDGHFALAQFEGSSTSTVVKLQITDDVLDMNLPSSAEHALTGHMLPTDNAIPQLTLLVNMRGSHD